MIFWIFVRYEVVFVGSLFKVEGGFKWILIFYDVVEKVSIDKNLVSELKNLILEFN